MCSSLSHCHSDINWPFFAYIWDSTKLISLLPAKSLLESLKREAVCVCVLIHSVRYDALRHHGLIRGGLQAKILEWVAVSHPRVPSQPRNEPKSSALQVDSLPKGQEIWKGGRKHISVFPIPVTMKCNGSSLWHCATASVTLQNFLHPGTF